MRRLNLPIWTVMVVVAFVAVGFAALKNPIESVASAVFSLAVGSLCVAPVVAVASGGSKRMAWLAFATFGWAYLGLTFFGHSVPTPRFVPTAWVEATLDRLETMIDPDHEPASVRVLTFRGSGVVFVSEQPAFSNGPTEKAIRFRQIGHSLATLFIGMVAALVTAVVVGLSPRKHTGTHALERS